MRVGMIALLHESNTFISEPTTLRHFEENWLLAGAAFGEAAAGTYHETGGFLAGLAEHQIEAVPVFGARATPYGTIDADTYATLLERMFAELERAGPLHGILVAPHGATVSEAHPDADGYWLSELRARVGPALPLIGTLDAHANLSPLMVEATDALVAYRSNPHLDQRQRGMEAASLMAATLRGELRPAQAAAFPPLIINIERQLTGDPHLRPVYELADRQLQQPAVVSNSILLGFPYADVAEMGSATLVVTDNDAAAAQRYANELGNFMWQRRQDFVGRLIGIDEALDRTRQLGGPICLLDMGDNVGGGSPGDSTHLARALVERGLADAFVCLYDPESAARAGAAGVGATLELAAGGKTDALHGTPLRGRCTVRGLYDGTFTESEPRHGGMQQGDQGATAVVTMANLTVMLTSRRMAPFSLQQLVSCGLDPTSFRLLVAKGVNLPVAAYGPICEHMIRVNTPGCTTADLLQLEFARRRRPLFPFEPA